jgi:hypothetical protein
MSNKKFSHTAGFIALSLTCVAGAAYADEGGNGCANLPGHRALQAAL